jgi:hypothetical protein
MGFSLEGFWSFMLFSIGLSCIMAWVYLSTNRSILPGFLLHLASNFTGNLLLPYSNRVLDFRTVIILVLGLALGLWMQNRSKPFRISSMAKRNRIAASKADPLQDLSGMMRFEAVSAPELAGGEVVFTDFNQVTSNLVLSSPG